MCVICNKCWMNLNIASVWYQYSHNIQEIFINFTILNRVNPLNYKVVYFKHNSTIKLILFWTPTSKWWVYKFVNLWRMQISSWMIFKSKQIFHLELNTFNIEIISLLIYEKHMHIVVKTEWKINTILYFVLYWIWY